MTPAQQDQVIDECFQCKLCYVNCPYTPGRHEWAIDFPRLMLRADATGTPTGETAPAGDDERAGPHRSGGQGRHERRRWRTG